MSATMTPNGHALRSRALELDAGDELASFRSRFYLPPDTIYLDGNSLGPLSRDAETTLKRAIGEWKTMAIDGWTNGTPPLFTLAETLGQLTAPLIGAAADEVVVTN